MPDPKSPPRKLRILDQSTIHKGRAYDFVDLTVEYPDKAIRNKPIVRHNGAATILPLLDTPGGTLIVMVRNERVAIDDFLLELPAGGIDQNEEPIATARRELIEETGYQARQFEPLCRFLTTPGLTDELMHVFVARDLEHVGQDLEPYESLTVELVQPSTALEMVECNDIIDAKTMLTLRTAHARGII